MSSNPQPDNNKKPRRHLAQELRDLLPFAKQFPHEEEDLMRALYHFEPARPVDGPTKRGTEKSEEWIRRLQAYAEAGEGDIAQVSNT